jgi:hypothetical protein
MPTHLRRAGVSLVLTAQLTAGKLLIDTRAGADQVLTTGLAPDSIELQVIWKGLDQ